MGTTKGTQNELKSSISGTYRLKTEERRRTNDERQRTVENLREITHRNVTKAPRLGFSSRKQFSSLILSDYEVPRGLNPFLLHSYIYLQENKAGACHPAHPGDLTSPRRARLLPPEATAFWRKNLEGPSGPDCYLYPLFTKCTPSTFFGNFFSVTLRKSYGSLTEAYRT